MRRRDVMSLAAAVGTAAVAKRPATAIEAAIVPARLVTPPGTELLLGIRFIGLRDGQPVVRGRERVHYRFTGDGGVTMSAHSESFDPPVLRDVFYRLGSDWRPRECFVSSQSGTEFGGSGWYRWSEGEVEIEGHNPAAGRISRRVALESPARAVVAHPVSTDVLVGMAADTARVGGPISAQGVYLTSADPYGRTAPELVKGDVKVAYLGEEPVETPVGVFTGDHFLLYLPDGSGGHAPFQDLWCHAGSPVFLKSRARAPISTFYELATMEIVPPRR